MRCKALQRDSRKSRKIQEGFRELYMLTKFSRGLGDVLNRFNAFHEVSEGCVGAA